MLAVHLLSPLQVFAVDSSDPDAVRARIRPVQSHTTLPEDFTTTNYVGEIKVDATGRFVYVSNRGHNSIAVYSIDQTTGFLTPVAIQKTGGKCPRHFGLSPCGHYAVVGDQDSNVVRVFKVCPRNGTLEQVEGGEYPMGSPCFVMVSTRSSSGPPAGLLFSARHVRMLAVLVRMLAVDRSEVFDYCLC